MTWLVPPYTPPTLTTTIYFYVPHITTLAHLRAHAHRTRRMRTHTIHRIQQNHDGLPQKAGFPQRAINEM